MCLRRALSLRAKVPGWAGPSAASAHIGAARPPGPCRGIVPPSASSGGMGARYYRGETDDLTLPLLQAFEELLGFVVSYWEASSPHVTGPSALPERYRVEYGEASSSAVDRREALTWLIDRGASGVIDAVC